MVTGRESATLVSSVLQPCCSQRQHLRAHCATQRGAGQPSPALSFRACARHTSRGAQRLEHRTGCRARGSWDPHHLHASPVRATDCGRAAAGAQSYGVAQPYYEAAALFQPLERRWALTAAACLRRAGTAVQARAARAPRQLLGARAPLRLRLSRAWCARGRRRQGTRRCWRPTPSARTACARWSSWQRRLV